MEESSKNIDLDNIKPTEAKSKFDATVFEGQRVKIEVIEVKEVIDYYPDGDNQYNPDSKAMKSIVEVTTFPLKDVEIDKDGNSKILDTIVQFTQEDGSLKPLVVRKRFNLQKDDSGNLVISKHPKAELWSFMKKLGVEKLSELKNRLVTITTTPSKKEGDDRRFLTIVTK